ncbi:helix-turn-helix domain-containing protein [Brevibacillus antibioticus]|uniref:helix-turn-helix domain-containing protein n=1 Tax=Brevibacillus antibioticus TaxID=2570228 RepID=UPI00138FE669|nr:helix-turn-helix transcriptional regulator [Brevibacillus antibioticus]
MATTKERKTTLGELIKRYRGNTSLSELSRVSGVSKSVIGKIENGETKRPELKTLIPIFSALNIPKEEMMELYIKIEDRFEILYELLLEELEFDNVSLCRKLAEKIMECPGEESWTLADRLYKLAVSVKESPLKLVLLEVLIKYCRIRGIHPIFARSLLQRYLLERTDLNRLRETFKLGEEVKHYLEFLNIEEKITFLFRFALHAHNIQEYVMCIESCKQGIELEKKDTELKARAYLSMINCYSYTANYDEVEKHLDIFETFKHDFVGEASLLTRAIVKSRKKEFDLAIPLLKKCLDETSKQAQIHVENELLDIYLQLGDMKSIVGLISREDLFLPRNPETPYKYSAIGSYFRLKGIYRFRTGLFDLGVESFIKSIGAYKTINAHEEINICMKELMKNICNSSMELKREHIAMLQEVL